MMDKSVAAPSPREYVTAFQEIGPLTAAQMRMLRIHYHAPESRITATQLASELGYGHYAFANRLYGALSRLMGEKLGYRPDPVYMGTMVLFEKRSGKWHWIMRPEVAEALEALGWVDGADPVSARGDRLADGLARG